MNTVLSVGTGVPEYPVAGGARLAPGEAGLDLRAVRRGRRWPHLARRDARRGGAPTHPPAHAAAKDHVDKIFHLIDVNQDGVVTPDELWQWCARDPRWLHSLDQLDTVL
ncbi:hypothetical protein EVAR_92933_1 [Eumeta japonica]|uniref:EF-hand domain-containing protein n=1 Tax=Eumeta variegata TaxID=151549 RepID=A0A4C1TD98_EUMVA|nr:hypothetical protein EVAR_92933_1 [Eumeta japonica]